MYYCSTVNFIDVNFEFTNFKQLKFKFKRIKMNLSAHFLRNI